jgi:hypothetical protein
MYVISARGRLVRRASYLQAHEDHVTLAPILNCCSADLLLHKAGTHRPNSQGISYIIGHLKN